MKINLKVCFFILLIILLYLANCIWKNTESFESIFSKNPICIIESTTFYIELDRMFNKIKDSFKDIKGYDGDIKNVFTCFGRLLTILLMSSPDIPNKLGYTELQTNVKMFKVALYKLFIDNEILKVPSTWVQYNQNPIRNIELQSFTSIENNLYKQNQRKIDIAWEYHEDPGFDNSETRTLKKMKYGLIQGGLIYNDGGIKEFPGLVGIFVKFKEMFELFARNPSTFDSTLVKAYFNDTDNTIFNMWYDNRVHMKNNLDNYIDEINKIIMEPFIVPNNTNSRIITILVPNCELPDIPK
jgi:hypothetical protein